MTKREFLAMGLSVVGARAMAQDPALTPPGRKQPVASRKAKTTKLFKSPSGFPERCCCDPGGLVDRRAETFRGDGRAVSFARAKGSFREGVAGRLERQGAQGGLDPVEKYQRHGRRWRIRLDVRQCAAAGCVSGRHEFQGGQSPADSSRSGERRRRLPWRSVPGRQAVDRRQPDPRDSSRRSQNMDAGVHDSDLSDAGP